MSFVIKYKDGMYDLCGRGIPVNKAKATRYKTRYEAENASMNLYAVACIEDIEDTNDPLGTPQAVFDALAAGTLTPLSALIKLKEILGCT